MSMPTRLIIVTLFFIIASGCQGDRDHQKMLSESRSQDHEVSNPVSEQKHWVVKGIVEPRQPEYEFSLLGGDQKPDVFNVREIEVRRGGELHPFQVIGNLDTETSRGEIFPGFVLQDVNFDGYNDIRLMQFRPPGPNIPYLYWTYDPGQKRFRRNRILETITSPEIDGQKKEIRSHWSDGAAREGTNVYRFFRQKPVLVKQIIKEYEDAGEYVLTIRERIGVELVETEKRVVRDNPE